MKVFSSLQQASKPAVHLILILILTGCAHPLPINIYAPVVGVAKDYAPLLQTRKKLDTKAPLFEIYFETTENLRKLAQSNELNFRVNVSECNRGEYDKKRSITGFPDIYDSAGIVDADKNIENPSHNKYRFYLRVSESNPALYNYDFKLAPRDICFHVMGGNMLGARSVSNLIHLKANALTEALHDVDQTK